MQTATDIIKSAIANNLPVYADGQTRAFKQYKIGANTIRIHKSDDFCAILDNIAA